MTPYCGIFTQSKKCGIMRAKCYYAVACKQQQRNGVFCAVRADACTHNNRICHDITKRQLHCNRGIVFSMQSVPRCYKQDQLAVAVRELLWFGHCELVAEARNPQKKGNIHCWKLLSSNGSEDVYVQQWTVRCSHVLYQRVQQIQPSIQNPSTVTPCTRGNTIHNQ
jgi:hypothetical protein